MNITLLDPTVPTWNNAIEQLYSALGGPDNGVLFPSHFLQTTLPRIGGHVVLLREESTLLGVGFLFPRLGTAHDPQAKVGYTLRLQRLLSAENVDFTSSCYQLAEQLGGAEITLYEPEATHHFAPTHTLIGVVDIGRPAAHEAAVVRALQQQVWGSTDAYLYPVDMHSTEFGLGTSLVARVDDQVVGFLFGFDKIGQPPLPADWQRRFHGTRRIESQTLGVQPAYRGARLGFLLKRAQAQLALQRGIQLINWTVDPLQWPNAQLNFGQLRALACHFMPDYYAFRNDLNRLPAARFGITWLINTARVQERLEGVARPEGTRGWRVPSGRAPSYMLDLSNQSTVLPINQGWRQVAEPLDAQQIAIEIPANWTALQSNNLAEAAQWRATTDRLFQQYIGQTPGQYVVTGVGVADEKRYLVAERVDEALWARLAGAG